MRYFDASKAVRTGRESTSDATSDAFDGCWPFSAPLPLPIAQRACCSSARQRVTVILPPASPGWESDLLLCGHHLRSSQSSLNTAGAVAFDARGQRVPLADEAA